MVLLTCTFAIWVNSIKWPFRNINVNSNWTDVYSCTESNYLKLQEATMHCQKKKKIRPMSWNCPKLLFTAYGSHGQELCPWAGITFKTLFSSRKEWTMPFFKQSGLIASLPVILNIFLFVCLLQNDLHITILKIMWFAWKWRYDDSEMLHCYNFCIFFALGFLVIIIRSSKNVQSIIWVVENVIITGIQLWHPKLSKICKGGGGFTWSSKSY